MSSRGFAKLALPALALLPVWGISGPAPAEKARPPMEVRVYSSVMGTVSDSQVRAVLEPMIDVLSARIDYPIHIDLERGTGPKAILAFGEKLNEGTYHLGGVWGLEYGWLREKYPGLQVLLLASNGIQASWRSQLMVRLQDHVGRIEQLKGKRLARVKDATLMEQLFLNEMLRQAGQDPQDFFKPTKPVPTVKDAALAVKNGQADCLLIHISDFIRLQNLQPKVASTLVAIEKTAPYPAPVLIGRPEHMDKLKPGLWQKLRKAGLTIHDTEEGQQTVRFWRFDKFIEPDAPFLKQVEKCTQEYPMKRLLDSP
jgi:ABC-type phosphate/phosphonate transport system substrate-binding protein